ncbi:MULTISPECIES: aminotransferase class V-fold PLP-dependent enzyme [unclassified Ruegeria]|uniref:aminotransferase class V-fold PLP-dependent enzyme n=1 Tax=unclassified Ruegeria TaxID=2625375 RepID=UPI001487E989|nr:MULTISPECIES: aminotransferase class V-fold PLP-dependent enzyme [unclassified Ruegeria]NOD34540.1 aminotransferase class V-fold PLP-dependent enzyme [Ruegeria sp. HKCCD7296]NOD47653.1 aminotransferase class V-fold PLP-dependent enzyme [Ruegeria sp. HKCCD5849]NOD52684.1 aminotransferase class V-fold PLP-dependent enzyme [Ruegeria sp. HKCCD5851]NOD66103.1 aminotransferase class V-fold PLP-dependent enzyme [Ruegeria sp. HKCCD7303]NOE35756.1 aminotransferase class V-fold PLP-dependent enzyme [
MIQDNPALIDAIRDRFAHVDSCPFQGERIFFENAGGALTLKSVAETSAFYAAIPDNPGRINPAGQGTQNVINKAKQDLTVFMNASSGQFFAGESGTELLFRLIRTACLTAPKGAKVIGSSIEHPATRSAARRWAGIAGLDYVNVAHDDDTGLVTPEDYAALMTPDVAVATILHASPVTGMGMDVAAISSAIRAVAPDCLIIVDGIQHAAHGQLDLDAYNVDGYAISPYKVFSRHGYGIAWISDKLSAVPHDMLIDAPATGWEFGTRDTGSYATVSDVVSYFDWLGGEVSDETEPRQRIEAAGRAIHAYETHLTNTAINGTGNLPGLRDMDHVTILAGADNPAREGLVSIVVDGHSSEDVVATLNAQGIRTHVRKADHYSGNVLNPLGLPDCIRISFCHYNTEKEIARLLAAVKEMGQDG